MAFVAGQKLRVSDLDGTGGATPTSGFQMVTSNIVAVNTTSFIDTGMIFDLAENSLYMFHSWLCYTALDNPGDFKFRPGVPGGSTGEWSMIGAQDDEAPSGGVLTDFKAQPVSGSIFTAGDSTGTLLITCFASGWIETTGAGEMQPQMAQRAATVTGTVLRRGSWMQVRRVA